MKEHLMQKPTENEARNYGVVANNLNLSIGGKELIKEASFAIYPGRKIALIGRNGSGKTTLLETIYSLKESREVPEAVTLNGSLSVLPATKIGYLEQNIQVTFSGTVAEYLNSCEEEVANTFNRYNQLTEMLNQNNQRDNVLEEYGEILDKMTALNAWDLPRKRKVILEGLDLSDQYLARDIKEISGGEATKIAVAGILLSSPNLILLDEPTNNLDPKSLFFLENWVKNSPCSLLLVSHDREFLDKTVEEILEIDEATKHIMLFGGNYSFYSRKKQEMFETQVKHYEEQQRKRKQLEEDANRLRREARRFESISDNAFYRSKGASLARRAKVQLERIERELNSIPVPVLPKKPSITVLESKENKDLIIKAEGVSFAYPDSEMNVFSNISFSIHGNERIGIIGPNGSGKTTLLKALLGEIQPTNGHVFLAGQSRISYLPQTYEIENPKEKVIDFIRKRVPIYEDDARSILGKVLFADPASMRVGDFSSGELKRVELIVLFASKPNLVILDEPTNHLDIHTIEMLEEALQKYSGASITVSHDQRFFKNIHVGKIVIFSPDGQVLEKTVKTPNSVEEIFEDAFLK